MPQLQALALASLKTQISDNTIGIELFSDISGWYDEVQTMLVDYAAAHWANVKDSRGLLKAQERFEEKRWAGNIAKRLARKLGRCCIASCESSV